MSVSAEEALIRSFVDAEQSERLVEYLERDGVREMLWDELAEPANLDGRFAEEIPLANQSPEEIASKLRAAGSPETCRIISRDADLDGLELNLIDAVDWVFGLGEPVFLSCISGKLAYFEGEDGSRRILERFGE